MNFHKNIRYPSMLSIRLFQIPVVYENTYPKKSFCSLVKYLSYQGLLCQLFVKYLKVQIYYPLLMQGCWSTLLVIMNSSEFGDLIFHLRYVTYPHSCYSHPLDNYPLTLQYFGAYSDC
jgi:hypothetical protein